MLMIVTAGRVMPLLWERHRCGRGGMEELVRVAEVAGAAWPKVATTAGVCHVPIMASICITISRCGC
jgi:hypothetical protein